MLTDIRAAVRALEADPADDRAWRLLYDVRDRLERLASVKFRSLR